MAVGNVDEDGCFGDGGDEVSSAFLFWRREDMPPVLFLAIRQAGKARSATPNTVVRGGKRGKGDIATSETGKQ